MRRFAALIFGLVLCAVPTWPLVASMSSASFVIPSEELTDAGGVSDSASYIVTDSLGELSAMQGQGSASFSLQTGFQTMAPEPVFTFSISSSSITLTPAPSLSTTATASTIVSTSTNAGFGYTTTIVDDGQFRSGPNSIPDVSDGVVGPVGTAEYGIGLTGADRAFTDDRATVSLPRTSPATPRVIASRNTFGANRDTTVNFKFTMSGATIDGSYAHIVTFVSTPNY